MGQDRPFKGSVTVRFRRRDDGGLRAYCGEVLGFFLSGIDRHAVMNDVIPALEANTVRKAVVKPDSSGAGAFARELSFAALGGLAKRSFDFLIAITALVVQTPIILAVAVLIRILMGKPVLFAQERIGFKGRTFTYYEFRTTVENGEGSLDRLAADHIRWAESLGEVLRRSGLHKLPQFFNVLRGDMSLVGPQPILVHQLQRYVSHAPECFSARPGLTGMRQANGRTCIAIDRHYVRHWSMRLDLALLMKTITAVDPAGGPT
jgi:exopolysaccharide production protein ExoY